MEKTTPERERLPAELSQVNLNAAGIDVGATSHFVAVSADRAEPPVQQLPSAPGMGLANWNWKAVHQFIWERFGGSISRSSCLNYLHRLGFAFKRPKKRLVKAGEKKREAFVAEYAALLKEIQGTGGRIFFVDEAHFRADAELRGKWVLRGEPALVIPPVPATERRPAIIQQYAWRPAR